MGPPGCHTTTREPKRAHLSVPVFKNTTKIPREDPQKREERKKFPAGEKKRAKFWAVQGKGGPAEGGPGETPQNLEHTHQQAPPTGTNRHHTNRHQQEQQQPGTTTTRNNNNRKFGQNIKTPKLAKCGLAKCGQHFETLILAKCGLAKCSHENKLAKFGFFGQMRFWPNAVWPNAGMTDEETKLIYTDNSFGVWQVLRGIILESFYVNTTQIRNKWDC